MFLVWFTIYGVKELAMDKREKLKRWYLYIGEEKQRKEDARQKRLANQKMSAKMKRKAFAALDVITLGSVSAYSRRSSEKSETNSRSPKTPISVANNPSETARQLIGQN